MSGHTILSLGERIENSLRIVDEQSDQLRYLRVSHDGFGRQGESLMQISHRHRHVYELTKQLANRGFMVYMANESVSRLVRDKAIQVIWTSVKNGLYKIYNNDVVYHFDAPEGIDARHLIVFFSDVSEHGSTTSLSRYFSNSIDDLKCRLPRGTAFLSIGDLGGACGLLHFNSERCKDREKNIKLLIQESIRRCGVEMRDVTLFGQRTGAAAAVYYSAVIGAGYVISDPIVPANDDKRLWHNPCFVENCQEIFDKIQRAKLDANAIAVSPITALTQESGDVLFFDCANDWLSIKNFTRTQREAKVEEFGEPLIFALALRTQGLETAQLLGRRW